jgi:hypothetical protein
MLVGFQLSDNDIDELVRPKRAIDGPRLIWPMAAAGAADCPEAIPLVIGRDKEC